jgi:hypothetical protein
LTVNPRASSNSLYNHPKSSSGNRAITHMTVNPRASSNSLYPHPKSSSGNRAITHMTVNPRASSNSLYPHPKSSSGNRAITHMTVNPRASSNSLYNHPNSGSGNREIILHRSHIPSKRCAKCTICNIYRSTSVYQPSEEPNTKWRITALGSGAQIIFVLRQAERRLRSVKRSYKYLLVWRIHIPVCICTSISQVPLGLQKVFHTTLHLLCS